MENNRYIPMQKEVTVDLKELFFYLLRKWKILVALMLVGALLGGAYATTKEGSESTTVVSSQSYLIASDFFSTDLIMAKISNLVLDDADLDALREEFGIEMENDEMRKMITIAQSKTATSPTAFADTSSGAKVTLTVTGEDSEVCQAVAKAVNQQMENLSASFAQEYENYHFEKISENMETTTTTTDAPSPIKNAVLSAVALAVVAAVCLSLLYVFNGYVRTTDELRDFFGLYPIAQLAADPKEHNSPSHVNSRDYLLNALQAMKLDKPLFCGDMSNAKIAETLEWLASQEEPYNINSTLAVEGQLRAADAGSIILVIQMWKTRKDDLKREMEICNKLEKKISGVIVLI